MGVCTHNGIPSRERNLVICGIKDGTKGPYSLNKPYSDKNHAFSFICGNDKKKKKERRARERSRRRRLKAVRDWEEENEDGDGLHNGWVSKYNTEENSSL